MKELIVRGCIIMSGSNKTLFVIFGGTGDLTYKKLVPAFYDLYVLNQVEPKDLEVVIIGRRDYTNETYRETYEETLFKHVRFKNRDEAHIQGFRELISYYKMDFHEPDHYFGLRDYLLERGNRALFYLAVAPHSFEEITEFLKTSGITAAMTDKQLLIEKPFGDDLESAIEVDKAIKKCFKESEIYRIDHYLAKEMMLNILTIRFGNMTFERLWDKDSIESIQVSALEEGGVNDRGNYYDITGALEDMFQSHLLQMLSYVLMDRPKSMQPKHLHRAQERALRRLKPPKLENFNSEFVLGQYVSNGEVNSYVDETHVKADSKTETFFAMKLTSSDKRFKDVPIYVRSGKRMKEQSTYIAITFKPVIGINGKEHDRNVLIIRIGPDEGIYFKVNIKRPGNFDETQTVSMDFCQSCIYENRLNTPQAYERLISHALKKDRTLFASWPIVTKSWELTEQLQSLVKESNNQIIPYTAFENGPKESKSLIKTNGHEWVNDEVLGQTFNGQ